MGSFVNDFNQRSSTVSSHHSPARCFFWSLSVLLTRRVSRTCNDFYSVVIISPKMPCCEKLVWLCKKDLRFREKYFASVSGCGFLQESAGPQQRTVARLGKVPMCWENCDKPHSEFYGHPPSMYMTHTFCAGKYFGLLVLNVVFFWFLKFTTDVKNIQTVIPAVMQQFLCWIWLQQRSPPSSIRQILPKPIWKCSSSSQHHSIIHLISTTSETLFELSMLKFVARNVFSRVNKVGKIKWSVCRNSAHCTF